MANPNQASRVATVDPADARTRSEIAALLERAERASGHPGLTEPSRLALAGPGDAFVGLVLRSEGTPAAYAQLGWRDGAWTVEVVLDPDRPAGAGAREPLLRAAVSMARRRGAREVRYWVNQHGLHDGAEARSLGFTVERDLLQMRAPLPLAVDRPPIDAAFSLRPFRPGQDELAWLEVNNRAFDGHPEQGHWDLPTLLAREQTSWFDPDGFVLCEAEGRLAGSCWTKVHTGHDPALGEIYVISVDPAFQHRGLGRVLTVAGLDWLAQRVSLGMLYVEKANRGAVELYGSLGFSVHHVDRCYLLEHL